ncbi:MAG: DegT/DnrJ/EryC1/StrS family aminotransferase [Clostridiales bacterium]|nr:DegT/DnrJ/EryC1/StrS family aminotransferase [Clostridiales bacterium]
MSENYPIPFCDLKRQYGMYFKKYSDAVGEVLKAADFCNGRFVKKFEGDFASFCGTSFACGVGSGTDALFLALRALGIKEGDEVILPSYTFVSTAWSVVYNGAVPVFVDCTEDTWEINGDKTEEAVTKKTKAIIGVHLFGQPFDFDKVKKTADKYSLPIVEDCAQAHGAKYKGRPVGGLGEVGCFSFYPTKNLASCGDAGCVVTNDEVCAKRVKSLSTHCAEKETGDHTDIGFNMRMGDIEAAVLGVNLSLLDELNGKRKVICEGYDRGITNPLIKKQNFSDDVTAARHMYVVTVDDREKFMAHMAKKGIECRIHYALPCHLMKAFSYLGYKEGSLKNSEYLSAHCVSLPMYSMLTEEEREIITDACNSYGK